MNKGQKAFLEEWLNTHDRIKSLAAGGYQTDNRQTAMIQFRRLMQREDIQDALKHRDTRQTDTERDELTAFCWEGIRDTGITTKDKASLARLLSQLKGWDKEPKHDDDELQPPTFQFMPFQPEGCGPVVPDDV